MACHTPQDGSPFFYIFIFTYYFSLCLPDGWIYNKYVQSTQFIGTAYNQYRSTRSVGAFWPVDTRFSVTNQNWFSVECTSKTRLCMDSVGLYPFTTYIRKNLCNHRFSYWFDLRHILNYETYYAKEWILTINVTISRQFIKNRAADYKNFQLLCYSLVLVALRFCCQKTSNRNDIKKITVLYLNTFSERHYTIYPVC